MSLRESIHRWGGEQAIETASVHYAGFWRRFFSAFIDILLFLPVYFLMLHLLGMGRADLVFTIFALLFFAWAFSMRWQATPGMRLAKVYVVDTQNKRLSFSHALIWGVTSMVGMMICFAGVLYLQTVVDLQGINALVMNNIDVIVRAQAGDVDPQLNTLLGGLSFEQYERLSNLALVITSVLLLFWSLAIALPRNKAGFHNWLCKTRFLVGHK